MMSNENKKKVLIVDNDERILGRFQALLENAGLDTGTTWSGREALGMLQTGEFDVLLIDDYLPDLHAADFLDRMRCLPVQPWVVVMQNSPPSADDVHHYDELGVSLVVDKRDSMKVLDAVWSACAEEPLSKVVKSESAA